MSAMTRAGSRIGIPHEPNANAPCTQSSTPATMRAVQRRRRRVTMQESYALFRLLDPGHHVLPIRPLRSEANLVALLQRLQDGRIFDPKRHRHRRHTERRDLTVLDGEFLS